MRNPFLPPKLQRVNAPAPKPSKKKLTQPRKPANSSRPYSTGRVGVFTAGATSQYPMQSRKRRSPLKKSLLSGVSGPGLEFLKCAFAPPDFNTTQVHGLPDDFQGNSLVKKHKLIDSVVLAASTDYYYWLAPIPGVAYFSATTVTGVAPVAATVWTPVRYADYSSLFGTLPTTVADVVDKFRFVSNHIELIPTTNAMQWTGNIQSWKIPVTIAPSNTTAGTFLVQGLNAATATNALQYTAPFNLGVYACAYNNGAKFDFSNVQENMGATLGQITGSGVLAANAGLGYAGIDPNFESVLIKISGIGTNISDSMILKTWACVEYQVMAGNAIYEYMTVSPSDKLAMELYRKIIQQLPTAVSYYDNESFWQRVLAIIQGISGVASFAPGPYGRIGKGVNMAATGIRELTM